jgi:hypothetical protein
MDDSETRVEHRCERCGKIFTRAKHHQKHVAKCDGTYIPRAGEAHGAENIDYVRCKICGFAASTLSKHLSSIHDMSKEEYVQQFPGALITCEKSAAKFKARGGNGDWIRRANERGDDLTAYKKKMGEAVRKSIMSNPKERARRSELAKMTINAWATSDEGRRIASETAKKTSARPEILEQRTKNLANWRFEHHDEFYEKCVKAMQDVKHSKPEMLLFEFLKNVEGYNFKLSQIVKSDSFTSKSKRKQIDIADKEARVYVEFDGPCHFQSLHGDEKLCEIRKRDVELDEHIKKHDWVLIRVSHDQFSYKSNGGFSESCVKQLREILSNPTPGVHFIGDAYVQREVDK